MFLAGPSCCEITVSCLAREGSSSQWVPNSYTYLVRIKLVPGTYFTYSKQCVSCYLLVCLMLLVGNRRVKQLAPVTGTVDAFCSYVVQLGVQPGVTPEQLTCCWCN